MKTKHKNGNLTPADRIVLSEASSHETSPAGLDYLLLCNRTIGLPLLRRVVAHPGVTNITLNRVIQDADAIEAAGPNSKHALDTIRNVAMLRIERNNRRERARAGMHL